MSAVTEDNIRALLEEVIDADLPPFTPLTTAKDVKGWDSLNHVRLLMKIESKYGIDIPVDRVEKLANVGDMVNLINELVAAAG